MTDLVFPTYVIWVYHIRTYIYIRCTFCRSDVLLMDNNKGRASGGIDLAGTYGTYY